MLKRKDFERMFNKMKATKKDCKHHIRAFIEIGHDVTIPVFVSHSSKEVPYFVIEKIAKSFNLDKPSFVSLCKCKISRDEYFEIQRDKSNE